MTKEEIVCKWITDKTKDGRGAVLFSLEENNGYIGVWVGEPDEHEPALGYGNDITEAVLDALGWEAVEQLLALDSGSGCALEDDSTLEDLLAGK